MKRIVPQFLLGLLMPVFSVAIMAQSYNMDINMRDGSVTTIPADQVTDVTFSMASKLPADAGDIKAVVDGIGGYILSIKPIENATSYCWIKDGVRLQESAALSCYTNTPGRFSVVGVNDYGEGKPSPEIQVTPITSVFNILTQECIPDTILRRHIDETYAGGSGTLTNLQAAAIPGGFYLPRNIESLKGIEYFISIDSLLTFVSNSYVREIDLSKNVNLKKIDLQDYFNLESLNIDGLNRLEHLNISWTGLQQFDINRIPSGIKYLGVGHLGYTDFDCKRFPQLETLVIYDNKLSGTFDVSGLSSLRQLKIMSCSQVTKVDVTGCTALNDLNVSYCSSLSSLDVSTCLALTNLYAQYTSLTDIDLSAQRGQMIAFNPQGSPIRELDLKGMRQLEVCQAGDCALEMAPDYSDCVMLKNIRLENTTFKQPVDVGKCLNMEDINIYQSSITAIALEDMPALWNVNMFSNYEQKTLDLKNLPAVQNLSCYDLPLIERVDISTVNHKAGISFNMCPALKEIKVWPEFDINNPPSNVSKDETAKFVYEFSE